MHAAIGRSWVRGSILSARAGPPGTTHVLVVDTSFPIDVLRGADTVKEAEQPIEKRGTAQVSSVTVMELWEGIHRTDSSERARTAVENLLTGLREVAVRSGLCDGCREE